MYVITGGAGFIGSALLWKLNALGLDEIVVVDNLADSQKWRNLVKCRYVDYLRRDQFMELVRARALPWKVDGIAHLGACSSTTENDSDFLMRNNFHYSRDLCRFALDGGIRFINASSAATFGAGEHGFADGSAIVPLLRPLNMYGYSKQLFDLWLLREGLDNACSSLKFFNVYGPNEYHKGSMRSVVAKLFAEISQSGKASLFASCAAGIGDGEQKRDFVYIKDVVDLLAWLLLRDREYTGIHNVGTGHAATFNALARAVFTAMNRECRIEYVPTPANIAKNYQNFTEADMSWLKSSGYGGEFQPIETGVADYVRNYLANSDPYL